MRNILYKATVTFDRFLMYSEHKKSATFQCSTALECSCELANIKARFLARFTQKSPWISNKFNDLN
jgi:hypothetical protein